MSPEPAQASEESAPHSDVPVYHPCPTDPDCPYCNGTNRNSPDRLDWSFLDGAYCISLKSRDDRAVNAAAEFHRVGLCQSVVFYRPVKHPKKGIIGSWESHRAVGVDALERGYERALILEDDVQFNRHLRPGRLRAIAKALERLPRDWTIFYIGHWPVWSYFVRYNTLRTSSACAHAYIISPRLSQWLRDHPWETPGIDKLRLVGKALDSAYAKLPQTYAYFPMIATQYASKSDNWNTRPRKAHKRWKVKHLVTRSRYREVYLSRLMRPNEMIIAALSPLFYVYHKVRRTEDKTS